MIQVPDNMTLTQQEETTVSSNGKPFICKQVYENAYKKITVWLDEHGNITRQKVDVVE